jgi:alpha-tubulin suppressor-like RCC1 family protein
MVCRSIYSLARLSRTCMAVALLAVGASAAVEVAASTPVAAAGSSVGLFAWGDNASGELGGGTSGGISATPAPVMLPPGVTPMSIAGGGGAGTGDPLANQYAGYAIGSDGNLYAWGDNTNGALGVLPTDLVDAEIPQMK